MMLHNWRNEMHLIAIVTQWILKKGGKLIINNNGVLKKNCFKFVEGKIGCQFVHLLVPRSNLSTPHSTQK